MSFHVPAQYRLRPGQSATAAGRDYETTDAVGNNGAFRFPASPRRPYGLFAIASDGSGWHQVHDEGLPWEHVSASTAVRCPTWEEMCFLKDLFWDSEDVVVQFHPPRSEWVNCHPYTLHLWRPIGIVLPRPPMRAV